MTDATRASQRIMWHADALEQAISCMHKSSCRSGADLVSFGYVQQPKQTM